MPEPKVAVVMGSRSDLPILNETIKVLEEFGVPCDVRILSAHRTPDEAAAYFRRAERRGIQVLICAAGGAAHLAGTAAAHSPLPVIAIPLDGPPFQGWTPCWLRCRCPQAFPWPRFPWAPGARGTPRTWPWRFWPFMTPT